MVYPALQDCILFQQWKKKEEKKENQCCWYRFAKHQQWRNSSGLVRTPTTDQERILCKFS
jgi:hypothetical protein